MHTPSNFFATAQAIHNELRADLGPPDVALPATQKGALIPPALVKNTRGYIEKIANQANGAYQNGWFDASAVMVRRLLETLIIEVFEAYGMAGKIQNAQGDFLYLRDLIAITLDEKAWNLSRNTKAALPKLKDVGDRSAHSRRFNAVRADVEKLGDDLRVVVQELIYLAKLHK